MSCVLLWLPGLGQGPSFRAADSFLASKLGPTSLPWAVGLVERRVLGCEQAESDEALAS